MTTAEIWKCAKCSAYNSSGCKKCPSCGFDPLTRQIDYGPLKDRRVASDAQRQPDPSHEPLATPKRACPDPAKRLVRFTSYRLRLLDERNLKDKYFTDALRYAGILFDDSPQWAKIEVEQVKVAHKSEERTEITITDYE